MAIDVNNARFLLALKRNGVDFRSVATVGRQGLYIPTPLIRGLFEEQGVFMEGGDGQFAGKEKLPYAEPFFEAMGAREIVSIDYSDYEKASILQDMNQPLAPSLYNRFSLLIDSGSLEHMFHFPQAIKNYMDMVKPGGYLVLVNMPVNNQMGHGFYQFSPELFYNLIDTENGFKTLKLLVAEDFPYSDFYEVINPKQAGERIGLCNNDPVLLFMVARKVANIDELIFPVQNDYAQSWSLKRAEQIHPGPDQQGIKESMRRIFKRISLKQYFKFNVKRNWNAKRKKYALSNSVFYKSTNISSMKVEQQEIYP